MGRIHERLGYGKTGDVEVEQFTRLLTGQIQDNEIVLFDRPADFNDSFEYVGFAPTGTNRTVPEWFILRARWFNNHKISVSFLTDAAWDSRTILSWPE